MEIDLAFRIHSGCRVNVRPSKQAKCKKIGCRFTWGIAIMARIDSMRAAHHAVRNRKTAFERRAILNKWLLPHMAACLAGFGGVLPSGALYAAEPEEPLVEIVVTG